MTFAVKPVSLESTQSAADAEKVAYDKQLRGENISGERRGSMVLRRAWMGVRGPRFSRWRAMMLFFFEQVRNLCAGGPEIEGVNMSSEVLHERGCNRF